MLNVTLLEDDRFTFALSVPARRPTPATLARPARRWRFGEFTFDLDAGLACREKRVRLSPVESSVLAVLLEAGGRTVSREALATGCWLCADVSDESISRAIYRLRRTMRDQGGQDVIETLYGRGYRVAVDVRIEDRGEVSLSLRDAIASLRKAREALAPDAGTDFRVAISELDRALTLLQPAVGT